MVSQRSIDYKAVLFLFLPKGILDYFQIVDYFDMCSYYLIFLEEYMEIPESLNHPDLVSKGFYP